MIKVENLFFSFSGNFSLSIDNLIITEGEVFTVTGPNGAGKTTFLNILALLEKPKSGRIEIFGRDILKEKDKLLFRRQMSFVFSRPYLLQGTVYDNVFLPLKLRGVRKRSYADEMLEVFKLTHLKDNAAFKLSQGEKQRVILARAFVTKPKLVLLDEPFLSLDPLSKKSLINDLQRIIKFNKITTLLVTQDRDEAISLAERIAVMKDGLILQVGKPQEFIQPVPEKIANFV